MAIVVSCFAFLFPPSPASAVDGITTFTGNGVGSPRDIAVGPDGNLWFTNRSTKVIGRINPNNGTVTTFSGPAGFMDYLGGITAGPDNSMWFIADTAQIGKINMQGQVSLFDIPLFAGGQPQNGDIVAGPDGNLWFSAVSPSAPRDRIVRMTPAGAITAFGPSSGAISPQRLTVGPDGAIWFTNAYQNAIGRLTTQGTMTLFPAPAGVDVTGSEGIATGPDGALWFVIAGADGIGRVTTAGAISRTTAPVGASQPSAITTGPDGNLWFTTKNLFSRGDTHLGRITPTGFVTNYFGPSGQMDSSEAITVGPDGALWFPIMFSNRIGRYVPVRPEQRRPDVLTGLATGPFKGDGIYSGSVSASQTQSATVARGATRTYRIRVQNDGSSVDRIRIGATESGATGFRTQYLVGSTSITEAIRAGTFRTDRLAPGQSITIKVKVTATNRSVRGSARTVAVTARAYDALDRLDVGRIKAKRS